MALSGKISHRKLPEGLLEISERVFVFNCCLTSNISNLHEYRAYIGHTLEQLHENFPESSLMVQNFGDENHQTQIINTLPKYGMTVINYHCQSKSCLSVPLETIQHFLSSSRKWISSGKRNLLLMHCENGCFLVLAFMLATFLIYNKQCTDESKILDMISSNVYGEWSRGPIFRIYGSDPFAAADRICKMLFSVPKESKAVRLFRQADFDLVRVNVNCPVQGDVVLECVNKDDLENTSPPSGRDEKLENVFLQNEAETVQKHEISSASSNLVNKDDQSLEVSPKNGASENSTTSPQAKLMVKSSDDSDSTPKKTDSSKQHIFVHRPAQSKIILPRISQISPNSRYRGATISALGITALLHDDTEFSNRKVQRPSTSASVSCQENPVAPTDTSRKPKSVPPPPPPPPQHAALPPAKSRQVVPPPPTPLSKGGPTYLQSVKGKLQSRASMRTQTQVQSRKAPLRAYHWLKLTRAVQGSLWAEAQKPEEASKVLELDISEIESLFSTIVTNSDDGDNGRKMNRRGSGLKPNKVHLVELRRAYNCEIMLTKVKVPLSDLMNSVLALDDSALDIDQVDNLIKFCPTKEEIELLKNYNGERENLGKCEQFFLELMKVPRVESKLRVFSFKIQFFSQVRNSVKLKRIMQSILSLGNALNHGTARGSAVGFRLDSLLKLSETRSHNNKLTLLHYLCKVLSEKLPEVLDFHEDLASLEAATKIQLKYLAEEMQALSKGLEKVSHELNSSEKDGAVSEYFCKTLKEFYGCAEAEVRALASIYSVAGRNADALALYFGEDPVRCPFEQVVSTLLNFVRMFSRAHEENRKQMEVEKKKAHTEAENEKSKVNNGSRKELEMRL
ncbi:formin-like protein [Striga asiatica]|uniref:Formin-like protein n=1 Tax=Striga asiatica TaxID=4170 RepID=A0A5A7PUR8_STRAF|nr:formin-like protein [Striga asiatica]